jgi:hypothetical protein
VGSVRSRPGSSGWSAAPLPVEVQMLSTCRDATTAAWWASGNVPILVARRLHGLVPGRAHAPMPMKQNITIGQIQQVACRASAGKPAKRGERNSLNCHPAARICGRHRFPGPRGRRDALPAPPTEPTP